MAATGFLSRDRCFATIEDAALDTCSSYPLTSTSGTKVYTWYCMGLSPNGSKLQLNRYETGVLDPVVQNVGFSYAACDPSEEYTDLLTTWGLLVAAIAAVFALRRVYSVFANPK